MAKKLHTISASYVYQGIKQDDYPSEEYKKRGWEICRKLIALAGYRLADWLKESLQAEADELYPLMPNPLLDPSFGKSD